MKSTSLKIKSELLIRLSNYCESNSNDNVIVNNKNALINWLKCNIMLNSFLKPVSKDSKESKSTKLGHRMEKHWFKTYSMIQKMGM